MSADKDPPAPKTAAPMAQLVDADRDELYQIRAALIEGENSGAPKPFDLVAFKRRMRRSD